MRATFRETTSYCTNFSDKQYWGKRRDRYVRKHQNVTVRSDGNEKSSPRRCPGRSVIFQGDLETHVQSETVLRCECNKLITLIEARRFQMIN
ncbi:hypothetical protein PUN28_000957 [Cardiocondyla obscurior]|uniref:Uncharacterized protein n=1 Tax=Cardiocondyla obscurior TaxID=286306 RepID=A0AAW2H1X6_9HYME